MLNITKHHFLVYYPTLSPLSYVEVPLVIAVKCQSHMGTALFTHTCARLLFVWQITLLHAHPLSRHSYTHTHTQKKLSRLFKCKCHHTWKVARKCRHSNGGTWQRSARIFSQCESEPCECLGLLCRPTDEKICVNVSLSDLKSLNKHFKAHFGVFEHHRQLICSWIKIWN